MGILTVEFDPLSLPPSSVDEPGSHGYFKYSIKCKEAVTLGNSIENTAYIYFDFNPAIITNTVVTLVADPFPTNVPEVAVSLLRVVPYPNPANDIIKLKVIGMDHPGNLTVKIFSSVGRLVLDEEINGREESINISALKAGMYFARVFDDEGKYIDTFRFVRLE
jgi:hypothetical protein